MNEMSIKDDIEEISKIAIEEILSPKFELTNQFLKVNKVLLEDGKPIIEDIFVNEEENTAEVYFPIIDESYYFVIYLDLKPALTVRFMNMSAGNSVQLFVSSESHSADELIDILGVNPTKKWSKGERRSKSKADIFYDFSGIIFEPISKRTVEVEDKLKKLIELLMPYKDNVLKVSRLASAEVQIAYYGYKDQMWGIHLDTEIISKLAEFNLPVDIDLYASGPDLG